MGRVCLAHAEHATPVPIEHHHVRPVSRGGQGTRTVQLCANAHGAVHDLLDVIEAIAYRSPFALVNEIIREIPRDVWAGYEGPVRVIAYKGWQSYGLGFLGNLYATEYRLWDSSGKAKREGVPAYSETLHAARWSRRWRRTLERL
jgi:hypothetical protein